MTDDAPNSSDPQARRRRRRRRRGGAGGDAQGGGERGEGSARAARSGERGAQEGQARQGERQAADEGGRKRGGAGESRREGGRAARGAGEARAGEERPGRRRRRRRRGEERPGRGEERPGRGEEAGAPARSRAGARASSESASDEGARGRGRGGKSRGRRRGGRPTAETRAIRAERATAGASADGAPAHPWAGEVSAGQGAAASRAEADAGGPDAGAHAWPDADPDTDMEPDTWADTWAGAAGKTPRAGAVDDDTPPEAVELRSDMPPDPPADDPDPLTEPAEGHAAAELGGRARLDAPVRNVIGVKFASAGRIYLYDAGDHAYARGEEVVVESDRGVRIGTVAVEAARRPYTHQQDLRRIMRRPSRSDVRQIERNEERARDALSLARDTARAMGTPVKIFRIEYAHTGKKALVYFTTEDRVDFRDLVRELSNALRCRVEMRQTGVRDEAKMVGGIGSCGRELCCTTWLPEFVPVSIKMAKDQGLVLNPTKVSGQCGRLKCCLVYEQATYAALRKGLPKLGKRVVTDAGEGRVVEVDVLHQRVRVSLGLGESQVFTADQVKPLFPPQSQKPGNGSDGRER